MVHFVNIEDFDSDVARQHRIDFVPYFKVFGADRRPLVEGKEAKAWLVAELKQRDTRAQ